MTAWVFRGDGGVWSRPIETMDTPIELWPDEFADFPPLVEAKGEADQYRRVAAQLARWCADMDPNGGGPYQWATRAFDTTEQQEQRNPMTTDQITVLTHTATLDADDLRALADVLDGLPATVLSGEIEIGGGPDRVAFDRDIDDGDDPVVRIVYRYPYLEDDQ